VGWKDRAAALWQEYGAGWPLDFVLGWIAVEQPKNDAPPTSMDEVGWPQLTPENAREIGYDWERIPTDEAYSFQALVAYMNHAAAKVPGKFTGSARLGMVKMWHTLPALFNQIADGAPASDDWDTLANWAGDNVSDSQVGGHSVDHWLTTVDKTLSTGGLLAAGFPALLAVPFGFAVVYPWTSLAVGALLVLLVYLWTQRRG
jgi:hypothetical protein